MRRSAGSLNSRRSYGTEYDRTLQQMQVNETEEVPLDSLEAPPTAEVNKTNAIKMQIEEKFKAATEYFQELPKSGKSRLSNDVKLQFYAWFKQATIGECTTERPGFFKFVEKKKWKAWHDLGTMSKDDAMIAYVTELERMKHANEEGTGQQDS